jgi:hypothetical protein
MDTLKTVIGKRHGGTVFSPVTYKCPSPCNQHVMANDFGASECPKCGKKVNVLPPKNQRY